MRESEREREGERERGREGERERGREDFYGSDVKLKQSNKTLCRSKVTLIPINIHWSISLIIPSTCSIRTINWYLMIISTQTMTMSIIIRK